VYTQAGCQPCKATIREFRKLGIEPDVIDVSQDHDAREFITSLNHLQTPVVHIGGGYVDSWDGHRPDQIQKWAEAIHSEE
jgi:glutaredoxin-like protein NrdH